MANQIVTTNDTYIIVGAGTMGLFLANMLLEANKKIIIIEAGNENIQSFNEVEYMVNGMPHTGVSIGRAKAIGGTSNLWGGQLASFVCNDITKENNFEQPQWPFNWDELQNYNKLAFQKLGYKVDFNEYIEKLHETNDMHIEKFYTYWLKQPNLRNFYYAKLQQNELVQWYSNATVNDAEFENEICNEIHFKQNNESYIIKEFGNVIFASGTLETSRLLLHTKRKTNCPYKTNNNIGKYFQDHINLKVGKIKPADKRFLNEYCNIVKNGNKLQPKIRLMPSRNYDQNYLGVCGYFSFSNNIAYNLDNFKQFIKAVTGRSASKVGLGGKVKLFIGTIKAIPKIAPLMYRYILENKIYIPFNSEISLCIQAQQISIPESSIEIDENILDANQLPKLILNWNVDGREFEKIEEFCNQLSSYLSANKLGQLQMEDWYLQEQKLKSNAWKKKITDIYHQSGGAIMGTNELNSVVDANCKIHLTSNMFVAGAAVLPTSGYANTGLTTFALTYKLAKHLIEKG
jgi:choline dehydrogenase-like flavoprotein